MKTLRVSPLVLLTLILAGCAGSGPGPKNINGPWLAQLSNPDGTLAYTFYSTLAQGSGPAVNITTFNFTSSAPCFSSATGQTATFSATGHSNGVQTGPFGMNVSSSLGTQVENVLTLNGTRNGDGSIFGTWTLTGLSGCSGNGNFTMNQPPPV